MAQCNVLRDSHIINDWRELNGNTYHHSKRHPPLGGVVINGGTIIGAGCSLPAGGHVRGVVLLVDGGAGLHPAFVCCTPG